jgi:hypothetical protein
MVAAMDRLARGTRETQDALAHEANIKREAGDVEEDTQGVPDALCSFAELQRERVGTQTDMMRATYAGSSTRRSHSPTGTRELRCLCWCAA